MELIRAFLVPLERLEYLSALKPRHARALVLRIGLDEFLVGVQGVVRLGGLEVRLRGAEKCLGAKYALRIFLREAQELLRRRDVHPVMPELLREVQVLVLPREGRSQSGQKSRTKHPKREYSMRARRAHVRKNPP
jgi:hypothetical protein